MAYKYHSPAIRELCEKIIEKAKEVHKLNKGKPIIFTCNPSDLRSVGKGAHDKNENNR